MMGALFTKGRVIGLALAAAIFVIDQAIKRWVSGPLGLTREGDQLDVLPFFELVRVHNQGVSLGMLEATSMEMRWLLVAGTAVIALVVLVWMMRERLMGDILGLSLILGGALGNIYDRYFWGYVIDYAHLFIGNFSPFLVFNVADACITIGVVIILVRSLFFSEKAEDDTDMPPARPAES